METGIDSFASIKTREGVTEADGNVQSMNELLERIEHADTYGLDLFGLGEHYRKEFLDYVSVLIYSAAATPTKNIMGQKWFQEYKRD